MVQLSFFPDNDEPEPTVRGSWPLVRLIDGHWCWKEINGDRYVPQPALERILLARLEREQMKEAA